MTSCTKEQRTYFTSEQVNNNELWMQMNMYKQAAHKSHMHEQCFYILVIICKYKVNLSFDAITLDVVPGIYRVVFF